LNGFTVSNQCPVHLNWTLVKVSRVEIREGRVGSNEHRFERLYGFNGKKMYM